MNEPNVQSPIIDSVSQAKSFQLPVSIAIVTLVIMVAFQALQLWRERQALELTVKNQSKALVESARVQKQFEGIASGTAELAGLGNQNALAIVAALQKAGVNFQNNSAQ